LQKFPFDEIYESERFERFERRTSSVCSDASTPLDSGKFTPLSPGTVEDDADSKPAFDCTSMCDSTPTSFAPDLDIEDTETPGIFCASVYANVRKPLTEAHTLPRHCYTSREWYKRELKKVFAPSWTFIGRTDEVAAAGSYLTLDTAWAGPVMVLRGHDGELRGFANVCRHRGAKLLSTSMGQAKSVGLTCPYHSWLYTLDGELKSAPGGRRRKLTAAKQVDGGDLQVVLPSTV